MSPLGRKVSRPNGRRIVARRKPDLPDIPVLASDSAAPASPDVSADASEPSAQQDMLDDRIRRMIEAAYT